MERPNQFWSSTSLNHQKRFCSHNQDAVQADSKEGGIVNAYGNNTKVTHSSRSDRMGHREHVQRSQKHKGVDTQGRNGIDWPYSSFRLIPRQDKPVFDDPLTSLRCRMGDVGVATRKLLERFSSAMEFYGFGKDFRDCILVDGCLGRRARGIVNFFDGNLERDSKDGGEFESGIFFLLRDTLRGKNHNHGCDGDDKHDETPEMGLQYSLYKKIDSENLECLNEKVQHSGRNVFKSWEDRLNFDKFVESDVDEELLFNIPFTGNIKLKGIIIIGGEGDSHPSKMRLFKNRPNMSFDDIAIEADQEFELHPDSTGTLEYATKIVKFSSVYHLSLHIPKNFGSESTKVYYIGLRGEYSQGHRHGVTICTYEARPNLADHKTRLNDSVSREIQ